MDHSHDFSGFSAQYRQDSDRLFSLPHDFQSLNGHLIVIYEDGCRIHDFGDFHGVDTSAGGKSLSDIKIRDQTQQLPSLINYGDRTEKEGFRHGADSTRSG